MGTNWDKLSSSGAINLPAGTVNIDLTSLSIAHFSNTSAYQWTIASGTSITGFSGATFNVLLTNFAPALNGGSFRVIQSGNSLVLEFDPNVAPAVTLSSPAQLGNGNGAPGVINIPSSAFQAYVPASSTAAVLTSLSFSVGNGGVTYNIADFTSYGLWYGTTSSFSSTTSWTRTTTSSGSVIRSTPFGSFMSFA